MFNSLTGSSKTTETRCRNQALWKHSEVGPANDQGGALALQQIV